MLKVQFAIAFILICMLPAAHAGNEGQLGETWELAGRSSARRHRPTACP